MGLQIVSQGTLNYSPGFKLAMRGWVESMEDGMTPPVVLFGGDMKTITAMLDGAPVGILVWQVIEHAKEAYVIWVYVAPECRRNGVYKEMFGQLKIEARAAELSRIVSGISPSNVASIKLAESQGCYPRMAEYVVGLS